MNAKDRQHQEWMETLDKAYSAGDEAARGAAPTPMVVGTPADPVASLLGKPDGGFDPDEPVYFVSEGACGFAWVNCRAKASDGRRFLNWLKGKTATKYPAGVALRQYSEETWRMTSSVNPPSADSYYGGVTVWVGGYGQSVARKEAFGRAFADVLNRAGVDGLTAYCGSRLD